MSLAAQLGKEEDEEEDEDEEESDDSLLEELATVAVKEGSDSDENPDNSGTEHDGDDDDDEDEDEDEDEDDGRHNRDDGDGDGDGDGGGGGGGGVGGEMGKEDEAQTSPDYTVDGSMLLSVVYEHNPGEVYPIAEEEEEAASPTASDGVTSLRSRARLNSG